MNVRGIFDMGDFEKRIEEFAELVNGSKHTVFFGGAGVSTESGIPDFRSKDGLYNQKDVQFDAYQPEYLLSIDCLVEHPDVFYEFYRQKLNVEDIKPNKAHYALAALEKNSKLDAVITQNIDGLHQKAGSKEVYEVHGTTMRNYCMRCKKIKPYDYIFKSSESIPLCECGGMIRPDVTLYGEMLPEAAWASSDRALETAELFIVGGTSLTVYPASGLVGRFRGRDLVIINRDITQYDSRARLVFRENIGEVFEALMNKLEIDFLV